MFSDAKKRKNKKTVIGNSTSANVMFTVYFKSGEQRPIQFSDTTNLKATKSYVDMDTKTCISINYRTTTIDAHIRGEFVNTLSSV